jgi:endonuclease/exonuclease/phosphatase (EEP) superfamily protein YafD
MTGPPRQVPVPDRRQDAADRGRRSRRSPRASNAAAVTARVLAAIPVALTLLPLSRTGRGWVRIWDFPRAQIAALGMLAEVALIRWSTRHPADRALTAALTASLLYQAARMAPYTPLYPRQVPAAVDPPPERCIRLLMANVLQENRRSDLVLAAIAGADPDVILLVETDEWWAGALDSLHRDYRWSESCVQDNHYGMLLWSRLPIAACELRFVVDPGVPSMRVLLRLRSGDEIVVYAVHPPPPLPDSPSWGRDAELVLTGQEIAADGRPSIVIGDLNDVAWSYTAKLFQRVSHMVDPRVGRGTFSTFHAEQPLARYPLDHVFHTRDFTLNELRVLPYTGSDHFPMLVELAFTPAAKGEVPRPEPTASDRENAEEIVEDAGERPSGPAAR